jgi:hypothetical protein
MYFSIDVYRYMLRDVGNVLVTTDLKDLNKIFVENTRPIP